MRSIWNGMLSFGLVNIPVKLYSATRSQEINFHYLHAEDEGRIKNERVCAKCGQEVKNEELVRGYEYEKGDYIILTDEDFAAITVPANRALTIEAFVDPTEIDPIFFEKPYYLAPAEHNTRLYALFRDALARSGKIAIARLVVREREHLVAIKSLGRALVLDMLYFADEIAPPRGFVLPKANEPVSQEEVAMAGQLIESMTEHFTPEQYRNTYREGVLSLIDRKREGGKVTVKPQPEREVTADERILETLRASIRRIETKRKRDMAA